MDILNTCESHSILLDSDAEPAIYAFYVFAWLIVFYVEKKQSVSLSRI